MAREGAVVDVGKATAEELSLPGSRGDIVTTAAVPTGRSWISVRCAGADEEVLDVNKYEIMRRTQVHARDMRIIDPLLSYPSAILAREKAIVLNLEHIKAIITAEEVLLREPWMENVIPVAKELRRRLKPADDPQRHDADASMEDEFPFEFRALEVALEAVCSFLDARTLELEAVARPAVDELVTKINSRNLDRVRKHKSSMTRLIARVQKVRDELVRLLEDDNDMSDLYLSRKITAEFSVLDGSGFPNYTPGSPTVDSKVGRVSKASQATFHGNEEDVEELEMLLEAYYGQVEGTLNKLTTLREYVDDTEDYINFQLDNHRNHLIQLELFLSACTLSFTFYSLIAGIFGMNIPYSWNDNHGEIFKWVVGLGGLVSGLMLIGILAYARYKGLIGT